MPDAKRRPIADFFILARDQPNVAFGWGVAVIVVLALVGFGVVKAVGGSGGSTANAGDAGAQITPPDGNGSGSSGSTAATTPTTKKGSHSTTTSARSGTTDTTSPSSGLSLGGSGGGGAPPGAVFPPDTAPLLPLPASAQKWVASPSNVLMRAGGLARGWVIVLNLSDTKGTVASPGCSSPPAGGTVGGRNSGAACHPGKPTVVLPHLTRKFMYTWRATQTGRGGAPPLAPGSYFFTIGPVSVHATVK